MNPILVVDDEPAIAELIQMTLENAGYTCHTAYDGLNAANAIEQNNYSLLLLDIMLPLYNGYDLLEYALPLNIPVIFITAKGTVQDRVKGLRLGADDYIVKPFEPEELLARVESVLRRSGAGFERLIFENTELDISAHSVKKEGIPVSLTPREFDLLAILMRSPNVTLTREYLYNTVWGMDADFDSRTLDLHINRIRKKMGWQRELCAVYKVGYRLEGKDHET